MNSFAHNQTDSIGAVNVVIDIVAKNIVHPMDPNDPQLPRLLELKRRLEEAKKRTKGQGGGKARNLEFHD